MTEIKYKFDKISELKGRYFDQYKNTIKNGSQNEYAYYKRD